MPNKADYDKGVEIRKKLSGKRVTVQPSAISLAWVREESPSFGSGCFFSLQPRLTQRSNMTLQHRWIFDGHSLPVNLQREIGIEPQHFSRLRPRLSGLA